MADEFGGKCNLRYDDTNPTKEDQEYIDAIERDVRWLGFDWGKNLFHASDYFEQLYEWAQHLTGAGTPTWTIRPRRRCGQRAAR